MYSVARFLPVRCLAIHVTLSTVQECRTVIKKMSADVLIVLQDALEGAGPPSIRPRTVTAEFPSDAKVAAAHRTRQSARECDVYFNAHGNIS
jgi:hypothetical protein